MYGEGDVIVDDDDDTDGEEETEARYSNARPEAIAADLESGVPSSSRLVGVVVVMAAVELVGVKSWIEPLFGVPSEEDRAGESEVVCMLVAVAEGGSGGGGGGGRGVDIVRCPPTGGG